MFLTAISIRIDVVWFVNILSMFQKRNFVLVYRIFIKIMPVYIFTRVSHTSPESAWNHNRQRHTENAHLSLSILKLWRVPYSILPNIPY
jgi:hypothetical protein